MSNKHWNEFGRWLSACFAIVCVDILYEMSVQNGCNPHCMSSMQRFGWNRTMLFSFLMCNNWIVAWIEFNWLTFPIFMPSICAWAELKRAIRMLILLSFRIWEISNSTVGGSAIGNKERGGKRDLAEIVSWWPELSVEIQLSLPQSSATHKLIPWCWNKLSAIVVNLRLLSIGRLLLIVECVQLWLRMLLEATIKAGHIYTMGPLVQLHSY